MKQKGFNFGITDARSWAFIFLLNFVNVNCKCLTVHSQQGFTAVVGGLFSQTAYGADPRSV